MFDLIKNEKVKFFAELVTLVLVLISGGGATYSFVTDQQIVNESDINEKMKAQEKTFQLQLDKRDIRISNVEKQQEQLKNDFDKVVVEMKGNIETIRKDQKETLKLLLEIKNSK